MCALYRDDYYSSELLKKKPPLISMEDLGPELHSVPAGLEPNKVDSVSESVGTAQLTGKH